MVKLSNKGYTLVELLAAMIIIGVVMGVTIPNITGIAAQNKITAYAEDAKKFKNAVEYAIRGDDTVKKPVKDNECIIANLGYVHGSDFDTAPNDGRYLMNKSFVVMVKKSDHQYHYYVQLVERYPVDEITGSCPAGKVCFDDNGKRFQFGDNFKGYAAIDYSSLEGDAYLNNISEATSLSSPFINIDFLPYANAADDAARNAAVNTLKSAISSSTGCTDLVAVYFVKENV